MVDLGEDEDRFDSFMMPLTCKCSSTCTYRYIVLNVLAVFNLRWANAESRLFNALVLNLRWANAESQLFDALVLNLRWANTGQTIN